MAGGNVVALLTGARRFYQRHGYVNTEPGEDQPILYYYRDLGKATS